MNSTTVAGSLRFCGIDRQEVFNQAMAGKTVVKARRRMVQTRTYDTEGFGERITINGQDAKLFWQNALPESGKTDKPKSRLSTLRAMLSGGRVRKNKAKEPGFVDSVQQFVNTPYPASEIAKGIAKQHASNAVHYLGSGNSHQQFIMQEGDAKGFVGYRVFNRVAVAEGVPCGDLPMEQVFKAWLKFVQKNHWKPVVIKAEPELIPIAKAARMKVVPIGTEGMVPLKDFNLAGKSRQTLRAGVNKAKKDGWQIKEYQESDWPEIHKLNHSWLKIHGGKEIGASMSKPSLQYLKETRTVVLRDKEGKLLAYMNTLELPKIKGRTVDLMRRQADAPRGAMEALFVHEIEKAKTDGLDYFDMELAPLSNLDTLSAYDGPRMVKVMKRMYNSTKIYDFQGLFKFKSKFATEWPARFMVYRSGRDLPSIMAAMFRLSQASKLLPWHKEA